MIGQDEDDRVASGRWLLLHAAGLVCVGAAASVVYVLRSPSGGILIGLCLGLPLVASLFAGHRLQPRESPNAEPVVPPPVAPRGFSEPPFGRPPFGFRDGRPGQPPFGVREPRRFRPGGRSSAAAIEEPDDEPVLMAVGSGHDRRFDA